MLEASNSGPAERSTHISPAEFLSRKLPSHSHSFRSLQTFVDSIAQEAQTDFFFNMAFITPIQSSK